MKEQTPCGECGHVHFLKRNAPETGRPVLACSRHCDCDLLLEDELIFRTSI